MILHGLDADVRKGDTILDPKFRDDEDELAIRKFDLVMANFPFSQENWTKTGTPKTDKKGKVVNKKDGSPQLVYPKEPFSDPYERFIYGNPPYSNGDFAFIQHIVASLNETGKAGVVCPQGVLFRGQPEKTEEEDGQNRKADDEYLIRRGFLQGKVDANGEFTEMVNIIDAIVVLPGNLFYGTTIPGAILFINKNKPEDRKDKVLMVYAAKEGWYKEEANMNVLLPHDILRISTILESWGNIDIAKEWIQSQKTRLRALIQEDLDYKLLEIEEYYAEDLEFLTNKLLKAKKVIEVKEKENKKPTKTQLKNVETAQNALNKIEAEKEAKIKAAHEQSKKERLSIDDVEQELLGMLQDPELRKRYFNIATMEDLEENEFNLNIPRYVDTFEPEEEIDLKKAIEDFEIVSRKESDTDSILSQILNQLP